MTGIHIKIKVGKCQKRRTDCGYGFQDMHIEWIIVQNNRGSIFNRNIG